MTMKTISHPAERLVESVAVSILAAAAGWSAWLLTATPAAAPAGAAAAILAGAFAFRRFGSGAPTTRPGFEPVAFEDGTDGGELLLDDPLVTIEPDSRVVQLFDRQEPTPGELVARISDYLGDERRAVQAAVSRHDDSAVDASAALHAALANIRASLR